MPTGSAAAGTSCTQCGSALRPNAPYCPSCGCAITNRQMPAAAAPPVTARAARPSDTPADHIVGVSRGVRCCSFLLDLAIIVSPALPLAVAGAILGVREVVLIVVPVACVAVWLWVSIWQGYTGLTFGKAMLGLRLIRAADRKPPGFAAGAMRSLIFAGTLGFAALPVLASATPRDGRHDKASGLTLIDVTVGHNPLGARQQTALRRTIDRSLNKIQSPVPVGRP
ncbi:hypothetical protein A7G45_12515 [Mycolicibacterium llatzerense]|nr:hypothetical protein [Mycolicibacterium llatzerense]